MSLPQPCHAFTDDELEEYLRGHSPMDHASAIVDHCRSCRDCQAQLTELEGFILGLKLALSRVEAEVVAATLLGDHDIEETETRDSPRLPCSTAVSAIFLDENGKMCRLEGELVDRSAGGAAMIVPEPMPVDVPVTVATKTSRLDVTMRYSRMSDAGYRVGVEIAGHHSRRR